MHKPELFELKNDASSHIPAPWQMKAEHMLLVHAQGMGLSGNSM